MPSCSVGASWQHWSITTSACVSVVAGDVTNIAEALGVPDRGRRVAAWMNSIVRSVAQTVADLTGGSATGSKPRVALLEWIDPIMGSGHWCA
jgi:ABC-type Fe3+-hydroxamate transport system substrate-binding protein